MQALVLALNKIKADHRYIVLYIYGNFKARYVRKKMKDYYMATAKATTAQEFISEMVKIAKFSENVIAYLLAIRVEHWLRHAWSPRPNSGLLLNNPFEYFNSFIGSENREKPILTMLEVIRKKIMDRIHQKRNKMVKYDGPIYPKIQKK